jgi:hypothetical protein
VDGRAYRMTCDVCVVAAGTGIDGLGGCFGVSSIRTNAG